MLLTRGMFSANPSCANLVPRGVSRFLQQSRRVSDCSDFDDAREFNPGGEREGVAIDYTVLAQPRRPDFGLDRLRIGAQGPIRSGDAEGLASVMEVFV